MDGGPHEDEFPARVMHRNESIKNIVHHYMEPGLLRETARLYRKLHDLHSEDDAYSSLEDMEIPDLLDLQDYLTEIRRIEGRKPGIKSRKPGRSRISLVRRDQWRRLESVMNNLRDGSGFHEMMLNSKTLLELGEDGIEALIRFFEDEYQMHSNYGEHQIYQINEADKHVSAQLALSIDSTEPVATEAKHRSLRHANKKRKRSTGDGDLHAPAIPASWEAKNTVDAKQDRHMRKRQRLKVDFESGSLHSRRKSDMGSSKIAQSQVEVSQPAQAGQDAGTRQPESHSSLEKQSFLSDHRGSLGPSQHDPSPSAVPTSSQHSPGEGNTKRKKKRKKKKKKKKRRKSTQSQLALDHTAASMTSPEKSTSSPVGLDRGDKEVDGEQEMLMGRDVSVEVDDFSIEANALRYSRDLTAQSDQNALDTYSGLRNGLTSDCEDQALSSIEHGVPETDSESEAVGVARTDQISDQERSEVAQDEPPHERSTESMHQSLHFMDLDEKDRSSSMHDNCSLSSRHSTEEAQIGREGLKSASPNDTTVHAKELEGSEPAHSMASDDVRSIASTSAVSEHGTGASKASDPERNSLPTPQHSPSRPKAKRQSTGLTSSFFKTSPLPKRSKSTLDDQPIRPSPSKKSRASPGASVIAMPPLSAKTFGLVQEILADQPLHLIVATILLNKTSGQAAIPVLWKFLEKYSTPESLARASTDDVLNVIGILGLQNARAKRLIDLAKMWLSDPPSAHRRHRSLHYPKTGDGGDILPLETIGPEDQDSRRGAWEIAHLPGIGAYALDSWRIFCRDQLRGLASDYSGLNAKLVNLGSIQRREGAEGEVEQSDLEVSFEPEWKRVLPQDKELRAFLRWMWLKEGYEWNPETGEKRKASLETLEKVNRGAEEVEVTGKAGLMGTVLHSPSVVDDVQSSAKSVPTNVLASLEVTERVTPPENDQRRTQSQPASDEVQRQDSSREVLQSQAHQTKGLEEGYANYVRFSRGRTSPASSSAKPTNSTSNFGVNGQSYADTGRNLVELISDDGNRICQSATDVALADPKNRPDSLELRSSYGAHSSGSRSLDARTSQSPSDGHKSSAQRVIDDVMTRASVHTGKQQRQGLSSTDSKVTSVSGDHGEYLSDVDSRLSEAHMAPSLSREMHTIQNPTNKTQTGTTPSVHTTHKDSIGISSSPSESPSPPPRKHNRASAPLQASRIVASVSDDDSFASAASDTYETAHTEATTSEKSGNKKTSDAAKWLDDISVTPSPRPSASPEKTFGARRALPQQTANNSKTGEKDTELASTQLTDPPPSTSTNAPTTVTSKASVFILPPRPGIGLSSYSARISRVRETGLNTPTRKRPNIREIFVEPNASPVDRNGIMEAKRLAWAAISKPETSVASPLPGTSRAGRSSVVTERSKQHETESPSAMSSNAPNWSRQQDLVPGYTTPRFQAINQRRPLRGSSSDVNAVEADQVLTNPQESDEQSTLVQSKHPTGKLQRIKQPNDLQNILPSLRTSSSRSINGSVDDSTGSHHGTSRGNTVADPWLRGPGPSRIGGDAHEQVEVRGNEQMRRVPSASTQRSSKDIALLSKAREDRAKLNTMAKAG